MRYQVKILLETHSHRLCKWRNPKLDRSAGYDCAGQGSVNGQLTLLAIAVSHKNLLEMTETVASI